MKGRLRQQHQIAAFGISLSYPKKTAQHLVASASQNENEELDNADRLLKLFSFILLVKSAICLAKVLSSDNTSLSNRSRASTKVGNPNFVSPRSFNNFLFFQNLKKKRHLKRRHLTF